MLLVLIAGWLLLVGPERTEAAELRAMAQQQTQVNERTVMQLAVLRAQAQRLPDQKARLEKVAAKIPTEPALPTLLRVLADAASRSGVEFVSLTPGLAAPAVPAPGPGEAGPATVPVAGTTGDSLHLLPVTINVVGNYYDIEQYLSSLERLPRALRVTALVVAPGKSPLNQEQSIASRAGGPATSSAGTSLSAAVTGQVFFTPTGSRGASGWRVRLRPPCPTRPGKERRP